MANWNIQTLRKVAGIGLAIVLFVDFILSIRTSSGWGLGIIMLVVFPVAVGLVSLLLMPQAAGTLLGNKDVLVPLALVTVAGKALGWLAAAPLLGALISSSMPLRFLGLSLGLSVSFLIHIALAVAYATWMTASVLALVRSGQRDPCRVLPASWSRFWRVLGLELIGWAAVMLLMSMLLLLMPALGFFALVPMAVFAVGWNFATAALLPVAMSSEAGFWQSFRDGISVSLGNVRRWWPLLLAQMLLLGMIFFFYSREGHNTNVSWNVNTFWTGGYEADCRWYDKVADVYLTAKLPLVDTLLGLLFGAFAVAIKVRIVQSMTSSGAAAPPIQRNPVNPVD
jgi:hypothetical protein